jgi:pimeloyl-ACP methyl ester carboxylesterase
MMGELWFFAWAWRLFANLRGRRLVGYLSFLINFRNLWQVLVSSDDLFGPLYNYASAELILNKLTAHSYQKGSGLPITLIGYSGGGQISLGAAPFIKEALQAPTHVISLGGVMSSNGGILELDSLTHLYGRRDNVQRLGFILFPQRWSVLKYTPWNQARQRGIIRTLFVGPMNHTGRKGYLDDDATIGQKTFLQHTVVTMQTLIREHTTTTNVQN